MITGKRRRRMQALTARYAEANGLELGDGIAWKAAVRLGQFAVSAAELRDWLAMCGLVPEGKPRPYQHMGLTGERRTSYTRPGAA